MPWNPLRRTRRETTTDSLRHLRTHVAAQASELATIRVQIGQIQAAIDQIKTEHADGLTAIAAIVGAQSDAVETLANHLATGENR